ncbi:MAG: Bug family tripartite tricarboxylate transporter substrate binding protein, partial [Burkholderiales bacterium]
MKLAYLPLMCLVSVFTLCVTPRSASAQQDYPTKPVRIVVGVAPGGATDILARVVGTKMSENLRQPVIVENRPGANHIIGGQFTAKAAPDGYTIQVVPEGWVINAS